MMVKEYDLAQFGVVAWDDNVCGWSEQMVHGSPQDRGSADAYYGRPFDPHWWPEGTLKGTRIEAKDMTAGQLYEYRYGYEKEEDRKDWG